MGHTDIDQNWITKNESGEGNEMVGGREVIQNLVLTTDGEGGLHWHYKDPKEIFEVPDEHQIVDLSGKGNGNPILIWREKDRKVGVMESPEGEVLEVPEGVEVVDLTSDKWIITKNGEEAKIEKRNLQPDEIVENKD